MNKKTDNLLKKVRLKTLKVLGLPKEPTALTESELNKFIEATEVFKRSMEKELSTPVDTNLPMSHWLRFAELSHGPVVLATDTKKFTITVEEDDGKSV